MAMVVKLIKETWKAKVRRYNRSSELAKRDYSINRAERRKGMRGKR